MGQGAEQGRGAQAFCPSSRLLRPEQFQRALRTGVAASDGILQLYACPNQVSRCRLGVIVGRRELPRAVDRNRVKRVLREIFRRSVDQRMAKDLVIRVKGRVNREHLKTLGNLATKLLGPYRTG